MFTQIERELRQSIAEYENTDKMVDAVAFVANGDLLADLVFADVSRARHGCPAGRKQNGSSKKPLPHFTVLRAV